MSAPQFQKGQPVTEKGDRPSDQLVQYLDALRREVDELRALIASHHP